MDTSERCPIHSHLTKQITECCPTQDEPWKFALGCVGVAFIGLSAEALIWFRRRRQQQQQQQHRRSTALHLLEEGACYAGSILLGYAAMLVAMTYSVELFLSVCLGLVVGHALLNTK